MVLNRDEITFYGGKKMSLEKTLTVETVGDAAEMVSSAAAVTIAASDAEILPDSDGGVITSGTVTTIDGVPELEYMHGCTATVIGMIFGYYDRNGYKGYDFSNLIDGKAELDARGLDGNIHDMDAFDTNLGSAVASEEFVARFVGTTPAKEFQYSFTQSGSNLYLNTSAWNCIADYIGTGQYWRHNTDNFTSHYYDTLADIKNYTFTLEISDSSTGKTVDVPAKYVDLLYGLDLYVTSRGYSLDEDKTLTSYVDTYEDKNGTFTFEDYKAEIDAGRCVIISIEGHAMLGYGYDDSTDEVIFDDTYRRDQRMEWGGSYYYSGRSREMRSVTTIVLDTTGESTWVLPVPDAPENLTASTTAPTNQNVTVTASFDPDAYANWYSLNQGQSWKRYYSSGVTVSSNLTVSFKSTNKNGASSKSVFYKVSNIDKTAPNAPTVAVSTTAANVSTVTVSATFSSDSAKKQYSYDNSVWYTYRGSITLSANDTLYFRGIDAVGNISAVASKTVSNIAVADDLEKPVITASTTAATNKDVILWADSGDNAVKVEYSRNNADWFTYDEATGVSMAANGTAYFRSVNITGVKSAVTTYKVTNIDKVAPTAPTTAVSTTSSNVKSVTVTASYSSDSAKKEYSFDKTVWQTYSGGVTVTENRSLYFRGTDAAGNHSSITARTISNIAANTVTTPTVTASTTKPTNQNVVLTATYTTGGSIEYSLDYEIWQSCPAGGKLTVTQNATIFFRGVDKFGNRSAAKHFTVSNIDKTAPAKPTVSVSTSKKTEGTVTVYAAFDSDASTRQYSLDNKTWKTYSSGVSMSKNGTVYFRGVDAAGNRSAVASYKVSNIVDQTAPTGGKITLKQTSGTSVSVSISGFTDKGGIARYDVYLAGKKIGSTTSTAYTYKAASQLTGTLKFSVKAVDTSGNVSAGRSASLTTKKFTVLTVVGTATEKTTTLKWNPVTMAEPLKQYEISIAGVKKVYKSKTNSVTIKKLAAGNQKFTVYAVDKAKNRKLVASNEEIHIKDITAPKGGRLKLTQKSQNSVQLAISNFKDNVGVKSYEVYLGSTKVGTTTSSSYTYNGKDLGGKLQFSVYAVDAAGNKSKAKKASIKIKDATAPTKVTGLKVSGTPNEKTSVLTWTAAKDNVGVTQYEIKVSGSTKVYKSKTNSVTIKKLTPGKHTYTVTAIDKAKNRSTVSASAAFTVKDITAPKGGSVKLAQSGNTIKFTISKFKDNVGVKSYEVYLGDKKVGTTSSAAYTYKGALTAGKMQFSVVAVDAAGNKSKAKKASIKVTPIADKTGDALTEFLPDSTGSVDLAAWNDQNSGLNGGDDLPGGLLPDSDGDMLCGTDLIDLGELTGNTDNAVGAVDLLNDDLKNKSNGFNGTLA